MFWYILIIWNIFVMLLYGIDKFKAKGGFRRISEATLIASAFLFGSAGALFGMVLFNHKTSKTKFRFSVPFAVLLHCALIYCLSLKKIIILKENLLHLQKSMIQ